MGLAEAIIAIGITALVMLSMIAITVFSSRSFVALTNYVELDDHNRVAMDTLTRDLRECNRVTACTTNSLEIEDSDGFAITYVHSSGDRTLTRTKNSSPKVLLTGCDNCQFVLRQRNTITNTYDVFPSATVANAKVVDVAWNCSREILGQKANTENVQTARIVIRKQDL
jgi:Tfp pilus assembly protein PilW